MSIEEFKIGAHTIRSDPDHRLILYLYNGPLSPDQARELIRVSNKILDQHPGMYAVCDAGNTSIPPETRKLLSVWFKEQIFPAMVCFGTDLTTRTLATLVTSASRLLGGTMPRYVFVNSEAEAYVWVKNQPPYKAAR
jgi:hypothetical protein